MKNSLVTIITFFIGSTIIMAQHNKKETIEGNGHVVTKEIPISSFDELSASGIYDLKLLQGNQEGVKIEADENIQAYFTIKNEGKKLVIDMKKIELKNVKIKDKIKVYVSFKKLNLLELNTIGNVTSDKQLNFDELVMKNSGVGNVDINMTVKELDLSNNNVGNVRLSGKAQQVVVKNTGVGSFRAYNLVVDTMNIENTGVGNAEVNALTKLKVKDSFLGKVKNKGTATIRRMNKVRV